MGDRGVTRGDLSESHLRFVLVCAYICHNYRVVSCIYIYHDYHVVSCVAVHLNK